MARRVCAAVAVAAAFGIIGCTQAPPRPSTPPAVQAAPDVLAQLRARLRTSVDRTSAVIDAGTLNGVDLARVLCTRAEAYADLGDVGRGVADAEAAVQAAPASTDAQLCRAHLAFANADFAGAAAAYTRVLEHAEDPFEALYRRGHAHFFDGRFGLAATDFARAGAAQPDPTARLYALLWQTMALKRQARPLPRTLLAEAARVTHGDWPRPALALLAGVGSVDAMMGAVDIDAHGEGHALALAEAWFYVGEHALVQGRPGAARDAFVAARRPGATMTLAHIAAGFELDRLQR